MSLQDLFAQIKYDESAHFHIQRIENGRYWVTIGETLTTSFECDTPEQGIAEAVQLATPSRLFEDETERRANAVQEWAQRKNTKIDLEIRKRIACGENKNRLICSVVVTFGDEEPILLDPVCGWNDQHVKMVALSSCYLKTL